MKTIDSLEQAQRSVPSIVRALGQDPALAQRALANPLLAAEELGYEFTPEIRPVLERRVRFPLATFEKLQRLSGRIQRIAGHRFNVDSAMELDTVLFKELGLRRPRGRISQQLPAEKVSGGTDFGHVTARLPWQTSFTPKVTDPLESLRGQNPIIEPLLQYRAIDATEPGLAPPSVYEMLKSGAVTLPISGVTFRIQRGSKRRGQAG